MKTQISKLVLLLAVVLAGACGANATDICNKACTKAGNCANPPATSVQVGQCQATADCAHLNENPQHCKNFNDMVNCANDCLGRDCNTFLACFNGCPQCQQ